MTDGDKHMRMHTHLNAATGRRKEKRDGLSYSAGPDERCSSVLSDSFQIEPAGAVEGGNPRTLLMDLQLDEAGKAARGAELLDRDTTTTVEENSLSKCKKTKNKMRMLALFLVFVLSDLV